MHQKEKRDFKSVVIIILFFVVVLMAISVVSLAKNLNVDTTTESHLGSWNVKFTNIITKDTIGSATSRITPTYSGTSASFYVDLVEPGDQITHEIMINNYGTIDARLDKIIVVDEDVSDYISYRIEDIGEGKVLKAGENTKFNVVVEYLSITEDSELKNNDNPIYISLAFVQAR